MKTILYNIAGIFALSLWLTSCDIKENNIEPTVSFVKIYDNNDFERAYHPIDIKQTADSGFIILGSANIKESDFPGVYLLKIDKQGNFQWEHLSTSYVYPASTLMPAGNSWQFFCMDKDNLGTQLMKADSIPQPVQSLGELTYPLAASQIPNGFLVQSYDRISQKTKLSRLSGNGNISWTSEYDVYEDVEDLIIYQLTGRKKALPFFTGMSTSGHLFFNGFNNFTLALTFVNPATGEQTGVINGTRYESAVSSVQPVENNQFAIARYNEDGKNVYIPTANISASTVKSAGDFTGNYLPELSPYAKVIINRAVINQKNIIFYASDTKNGQIVLFAYDEKSGALLGTKYLGAGNTFEIGGFTTTAGGGMAVAGKTHVAGRFSRVCVFKLSKDEVDSMISQAKQD